MKNDLHHVPSVRVMMARLIESLFVIVCIGAPATVYLMSVLGPATSSFGLTYGHLFLEVAGIGCVVTLVVVMSIWLALSPVHILKRFILAGVGIGLAGGAMGAITSDHEVLLYLFAAIIVGNVVVGAFVLRWRGFMMVRMAQLKNARPFAVQFSIAQVMILTALVALMLLGIRIISTNNAGGGPMTDVLLGFLFISCVLTAPAVLVAWSTLRSKLSRAGMWIFFCAAGCLVAVTRWGLELISPLPSEVWSCLVLVHYMTMIPTLLLLRWLGYRILHVPAT